MIIAEIKRLAETHTIELLTEAIRAYYETKTFGVDVEGKDDGEKYTHLYGSAWVLNHMKEHGSDIRTALRAYGALLRF